MSSSVDKLKAPIEEELELFEQKFREVMRSHVSLLDKVNYYIYQRKGKQVRPMFIFLAAKMCGGVTEATYIGASLVELLHTATLVHDDVVDDSYERRGFFSVNAIWKNKIAVLVGDYFLSKGLLLALDTNNYNLLHITSTSKYMVILKCFSLKTQPIILLNFYLDIFLFKYLYPGASVSFAGVCRYR